MRTLLALGAVCSMACSTPSESGRFGSLNLSLSACPDIQGGVLEPYEVCGFSVAVHRGTWNTGAPAVVFESECLPYKGDQVTIENIETGGNNTVYYEVYAQPDCSGSPALIGARGGIEITKSMDSEAIWHIPTFEVGGFRGLPVFDPELRARAAATSCTADDQCLGTDGNDHYVLSPVASCDAPAGHCVLPESLYPLNQGARRAFHSAVSLDDGRIAVFGGFTREIDESVFDANSDLDADVEIFDPSTLTWSTPEIAQLEGHSTAFHKAVHLGGSRVALVGGVRRAQLHVGTNNADAGVTPGAIRVTAPIQTGQDDNVSSLLFVVDLDAEETEIGAIGTARFMVDASLVNTAAGERLLVTGGATPVGDGRVPQSVVELCDLNNPDGIVCATPANPSVVMAGPRLGHCSLCLDDDPGPACERTMIFGGLGPEGSGDGQIADIYGGALFASITWDTLSAWQGSPLFSACVRSGQRMYFIGGTNQLQAAPSVPALTLSLSDVSEDTLAVGLIQDANGGALKRRVHHAATLLADGRVLVTGGLGANGFPVASADVLKDDERVRQAPMAIARFGHSATLITTGPVKDAVLISGGFTRDESGALRLAEGAEIYVPDSL
jgi:hypothetical protein